MHNTCTSECTNRHNKVAGYIHWNIRNLMGLQATEKYCEYIPEKVIISKVPLLCGMYRLSEIEQY